MTDYSYVRGFNYQPGYAYNSYEAWRFFDPSVFRRDLALGKAAFPRFNTVRYWLSYEAFRYEEDRQARNFEEALTIADELGLKVVPVLFNRWHDYDMDNGGVYIDQFVPESCWCSGRGGVPWKGYIDRIVGEHRSDTRILAWDTCNEPYAYGSNEPFTTLIAKYEKRWLEDLYRLCKDAGASQPVSFSPYNPSVELYEEHRDICDIFLVHRYVLRIDDMERNIDEQARFLSQISDMARAIDKGIFTTETCWGAFDDAARVDLIRAALEAHRRAGLGFIAHALVYSHVADLHDPCDGPVGPAGNLCFLTKDGKLRPGHGIFNEY